MKNICKLDNFEKDGFWYSLYYYPGDGRYVIYKLKKSTVVTRGKTIYKGNNKKEAEEKFRQLREK